MKILNSKYIISGTKAIHVPNLGYPEFVFMGRSNVGKSSFINAITNRKNLAYTSSKPGKTITLNFYSFNDQYLLVDVPGYGYAQRTVDQRLAFGNMIEDYLMNSNHLAICFLIVDIRHEPSKDDILMYEYLKHFNLKVCVIATKLDKLSKNEAAKNINMIKKVLKINENDKLIAFSSLSKQGIDEVYNIFESYK